MIPANVETIQFNGRLHRQRGQPTGSWPSGFKGTLKGMGGNDFIRAGNGGYLVDGGDGNDET